MAGRKRMKPTVKYSLYFAIAILAIMVSYFAISNYRLQSQYSGFQTTGATSYKFIVYDALNSSNDDDMRDAVTINIFSKDISGLSDSDISDLVFSDFTLEKTIDSNDTFTPDDDKIYIFKVNGSDVVTKYYVSDYRLFNSKVPIVSLGTVEIYCYNETEDVAMLAFDTETLSSTINQTDFRNWEIDVNCLDASEGSSAEVTSTQGYESHFDPENNRNDWIVIRIQFNTTTPKLSWVTYQSSDDYRASASGNYVYIEINRNIVGDNNIFKFKLGTGLGTDFEVIGYSFGHGSADAFTEWDSQN